MKLGSRRRDACYASGWQATLWLGVPFGLLVGAFSFGTTGSWSAAIFQAVFGILFFGPTMRWLARRYWPGASDLETSDRVAVLEIVRQGGPVADARLAPAVLEYVSVVRRAQDRDRRYSWILGLVALGTLILALAATVDGSARSAAIWWGMVVLWVFILGFMPRRQRRILSDASHAEADAQRALHFP